MVRKTEDTGSRGDRRLILVDNDEINDLRIKKLFTTILPCPLLSQLGRNLFVLRGVSCLYSRHQTPDTSNSF